MMSRQCGIHNISQPYRPPRSVMGIAFTLMMEAESSSEPLVSIKVHSVTTSTVQSPLLEPQLIYPEDEGRNFLRNIPYLPDYTALQLKIIYRSQAFTNLGYLVTIERNISMMRLEFRSYNTATRHEPSSMTAKIISFFFSFILLTFLFSSLFSYCFLIPSTCPPYRRSSPSPSMQNFPRTCSSVSLSLYPLPFSLSSTHPIFVLVPFPSSLSFTLKQSP
jgi:hypothetical protein